MKLLRHAAIQIRVGSTKNNSDGPPKLFELESCLRAGSYGWQQIFVQAKEGRTGPSPQTFARSESRVDNRGSYFREPVDRLSRDDAGRRNLVIFGFSSAVRFTNRRGCGISAALSLNLTKKGRTHSNV
jgi:hypothetical protein